MTHPRCKDCGKVAYPSEDAAKDALHGAAKAATRARKGHPGVPVRRRETRAYRHDSCGKWHLTSEV